MTARKLATLLYNHGILYDTIKHEMAFTASEIAQTAHIPGEMIAKCVIIRVDGEMVMTVLPASHQLDFTLLRNCLDATMVELVDEYEFRTLFTDCLPGAMPPFGELYGLDVIVDESLTQDEYIVFNAGTHTELLKMKFKDYERLVMPQIMKFAKKMTIHAA